jgi:NADH-quinone oxidoreductase subunit M
MGFPVLDVIIFVPAGAACAVAVMPAPFAATYAKRFALGAGVIELAFVAWMVVAFKTGNANAGFQFTSKESWFGALDISWYLGVDGISLFLVAMTALLFPIAMASPPVERSQKAYLVGCSCSSPPAWPASYRSTRSCSS